MLAGTTDPPRRPQVRASTEFSNGIDSLPRSPLRISQSPDTPHHAMSSTTRPHAGSITPGAAARRNHSAHALAIPAHVHGWTCCQHAPPSPARHRLRPALLLHQRLGPLPLHPPPTPQTP